MTNLKSCNLNFQKLSFSAQKLLKPPMKKQLRSTFQFASLMLLGVLGKASQANAQAFNFRSDIFSPVQNNLSVTVTINKFQQNCVGAIGTMMNLPISLS